MSFDLSAIHPVRAGHTVPEPTAARPAAAETSFANTVKATADAQVDTIPASPPADVMQEVLAAQRAIQDMHTRGRQLHFDMDSGRVRILLQDLDGNTIKEIPPSHALELAGDGTKVE
jgi:hypothetical protein